ncbi:MAG: ATP-binding cassette domain-containing protein [Pseudomonadota bacterium]
MRAALGADVRAITGVESAARLLRLAAMLCLAKLVGDVVVLGTLPVAVLATGGVLMALSVAGMAWAERLTVRAEAKAASTVLDWFFQFTARASVADVQAIDPGDLANRLSRQPSAAARAVVSVQVGKSMSSIGAMMALALMAFLSWQAALLLVLTLPIMIMFFVVVGNLTKSKAAAQEEALQDLSGAFAEKVRCLPTIVACDAAEGETARLASRLADYRVRSSALLRVAFLNSAVLDFFSSLSIAMLAIFLGLGHLGLVAFPGFSGIGLTASLGILLLAPEVFQPLRRFSELYHQAAEGEEALQALEPIAVTPQQTDKRLPVDRMGARGLVLKNGAVIGDWDLPSKGLIAITGPSGSGKTILLRTLAGVDAPKIGQVFRTADDAAWIAVDSWLPMDLLEADRHELLETLRLTDDPRFRQDAATIDLAAGEVSGGQRVRLALAHALGQDAPVLFADEPTAKLDRGSAEAVRQALKDAARDRLVLVATHDPALANAAMERLALEERNEVVA